MLKNSSVSRSDSKFFDGTNAVMPEIAFLFRGEYEVIIIGSSDPAASVSAYPGTTNSIFGQPRRQTTCTRSERYCPEQLRDSQRLSNKSMLVRAHA
jgi:hypothetical protein